MCTFDTRELKNLIFHDITDFGKTTTFLTVNDMCSPVIFYLDLHMYAGFLEQKPRGDHLAKITTSLYKDVLMVLDFCSEYENRGNGKQLFLNLFKCVDIALKQKNITKISGELSFMDFDHWDKLFHLYSHMKDYLS